ncbi:hypothetical protein NDU88_000221 [Pleurodeles waltl]|uniref:Uncharacterized protein n=1 Tax=Pleurodeles waltl TaxID=8319 RepID=A0AAV7P346_PLEWA|nr:hypothetical protein NDU88_000221 [Pleurodeles waltl]
MVLQDRLSYRQDCVLTAETEAASEWFCSRAQLQAGLRADGGSGVCGALLTALAVVPLARLSYRQDCVLTAEAASVERLLQLGQWFCSWAQLQAGLRADGVSSVRGALYSSGSGSAGQAQLQAGLRADSGSVV